MSAKAIREYHGKKLLARWISDYSAGAHNVEDRVVQVKAESLDATKFEIIAQENPWLLSTKLVVKPDQLIKRRGKAGLLAINKTWEEVQQWILERAGKEIQVETVHGILDTFIVEPFVPHEATDEYYMCISVSRTSADLHRIVTHRLDDLYYSQTETERNTCSTTRAV